MSYWNFFPAPEGWGRMPVWGFATVAESRVDGAGGGDARVRLPAAVERAARDAPSSVGPHGFLDASPHRAELPAAYNGYALTSTADPHTDADREDRADAAAAAVLHLLADRRLPARREMFGAGTVVLSSASSKTASGARVPALARGASTWSA